MPKILNENWKNTLDPDSEEYNPSFSEIKNDEKLLKEIEEQLREIESRLKNPQKDSFTGEINKFSAMDPEFFWSSLGYLRIDYLNEIKDKELQKQALNKILKTEKLVYRQFIPFIDSLINTYGRKNSPLEKTSNSYNIYPEEILSYFDQARSMSKEFNLSDKEQLEYTCELDRLQEKFNRYQSEATLFTFENAEEKLMEELYHFEFDYFGYRKNVERTALSNEESEKKLRQQFENFIMKANYLLQIAERMLNKNISKDCLARAKNLLENVEYLKAKNEAPRELFAIEAELKDLINLLKNGEIINLERLNEIGQRLSELKEKRIGLSFGLIINKLLLLFSQAKKIQAGEKIDEEKERFTNTNGIDWPWNLLGVRKDASEKEIKNVYHKLAEKYHPDRNKEEGAKEKMQKINEAFEKIGRIMGFK